MKSLSQMFQTDNTLETSGVVVDYGVCRVTLARAGGANEQYNKELRRLGKPYAKLAQAGMLSDAKVQEIQRKAFAAAVVRNWETNVGTEQKPEWVQGISLDNDRENILPFNAENVEQTCIALPDFYNSMLEESRTAALFRAQVQEDEAGN